MEAVKTMARQDANGGAPHRRRSAVGGMALGAAIGALYFAGLFAVIWYIDEKDDKKNELSLSLEATKHENHQLRALMNEIAQDNADLGALLPHPAGQSSSSAYPPSNDPSVAPQRRRP
jgi:hypothetical protein